VFSSAICPVPRVYLQGTHAEILNALPLHEKRFGPFLRAQNNDVGYEFDNGFFSSPDTEVFYTMVRMFRPKLILQIGCGNSTKVIPQAIMDGAFSSVLTCRGRGWQSVLRCNSTAAAGTSTARSLKHWMN
jgi:hypothetical protein